MRLKVHKYFNILRIYMVMMLPAFSTGSYAQSVAVTASLDSTLMFIGGQMQLKFEIAQDEGLNVAFPIFTDTIVKGVEIVESHPVDTSLLDNKRLLIQKSYTITSFDSGLYYIPPVELEFMEGEILRKAQSQALALMVINPFTEVNPEDGIFDLKQPYNLPFSIAELKKYINWLLLFFLLQAIIGLVIVYLNRREKPLKEIFVREKPKDPPHVIALRELDRIKNEKLWQSGRIKQFYSDLSDTLRRYIEDRYEVSTMEQTTGEIMRSMKRMELPDGKLYDKLGKVLETADLAKFAKYEPLPDENDFALISAYFFVNQTKIEPKPDLNELEAKDGEQGEAVEQSGKTEK